MPTPTSIDYSPLTDRVAFVQLRHEYQHATKLFKLGLWLGVAIVAIGAVTAFGLLISGSFGINGNHLFIAFLLACGFFVVVGVISRLRYSARLRGFAARNHLEYKLDRYAAGTYTNQLFNSGLVQIISSLTFANPIDGKTELGNFRIVGAHSFEQGYLSVSLPRRLPHMILSAIPHSFALPSDLAQTQHLSLEGDFDNYFKLYVPVGYERDALYVFTPDIMQLFKDNLRDFTIEIIDDRLYIYNGTKFKLNDRRLYIQLFNLLRTIMTKFDRQIEYYADENTALRSSNTIAQQGRLLKYRSVWYSLSILTISLVALIVLFNVGSLIGTTLGGVVIANLFIAIGTTIIHLIVVATRRS